MQTHSCVLWVINKKTSGKTCQYKTNTLAARPVQQINRFQNSGMLSQAFGSCAIGLQRSSSLFLKSSRHRTLFGVFRSSRSCRSSCRGCSFRSYWVKHGYQAAVGNNIQWSSYFHHRLLHCQLVSEQMDVPFSGACFILIRNRFFIEHGRKQVPSILKAKGGLLNIQIGIRQEYQHLLIPDSAVFKGGRRLFRGVYT